MLASPGPAVAEPQHNIVSGDMFGAIRIEKVGAHSVASDDCESYKHGEESNSDKGQSVDSDGEDDETNFGGWRGRRGRPGVRSDILLVLLPGGYILSWV